MPVVVIVASWKPRNLLLVSSRGAIVSKTWVFGMLVLACTELCVIVFCQRPNRDTNSRRCQRMKFPLQFSLLKTHTKILLLQFLFLGLFIFCELYYASWEAEYLLRRKIKIPTTEQYCMYLLSKIRNSDKLIYDVCVSKDWNYTTTTSSVQR